MRADLGHNEIKDYIKSLISDFKIYDYLEKDTFNEHYETNDVFDQARIYDRTAGGLGVCHRDVVIKGKSNELRDKINELNKSIEEFINQLAENENVIPSYEKNTFLYFNRVPSDWGYDLGIYSRNKAKEERIPIYKCNKCGKTFMYPHVEHTNVGYTGMFETPYWEDEFTSPCCNCEFEELEEDE